MLYRNSICHTGAWCCAPFPPPMLTPRVILWKGARIIPQYQKIWEWISCRVKWHAKVEHKAMWMASSLMLIFGDEVLTSCNIIWSWTLKSVRAYTSVRGNCFKRIRLPWSALYQNFTGDNGITAYDSPEIWIFFPDPDCTSDCNEDRNPSMEPICRILHIFRSATSWSGDRAYAAFRIF